MAYEVKGEEMTQEQWDEMKKIVQENICAVCEGELTIHTNPENGTLEVGCLYRDHHGYIERETYTQAFRRGAEIHPAIRDAIERKMVPKDDLGRAMNLLALRYPRAIENPESAALFIMDCCRLDLDPLIQPAEAVPVTFKSRKKKDGEWEEKVTVSMIITDDGWLSMAARGCKEEWNGPPRTMRLEEYLATLKENEGKSREEIQAIAKEIKQSEAKDPEAWCYAAIGRSKAMTEDTVIYGFFTHKDLKKAEDGRLPAFDTPGNQARVRARKKFVREVYPDCRQRMIDISREWYERSDGIKAAQEFIDAEYRLLSIPEGSEKTGEQEGEKVGARAPKARAQATKPASALAAEEKSPDETVEGEGFHIDPTWLKESLQELKWSDDTAKTFLASQYKVSPQGTLGDVISRLTREQAEEFVKEIQDRVAQKQMELFT